MGISLSFFFKIYIKYIKILESNGLNLELDFFSCYNSIFLFENNPLSYLKMSIKLERVISNLMFFSKVNKIEKQGKNKWFYYFIKVFQKKLKLYNFLKFFKIPDISFYKPVLNNIGDHYENSLNWFKYKFFKSSWKNQSICWKMITTVFTCSVCRKIVGSVNSYKIFEFTNFVQTLFFLKQLTVSSTSTFSTCKFCSEITKIVKKCLLSSNNFSIWVNFKFLKKRFKKFFVELKNKRIITIRSYPISCELFLLKNNIFFENHSFSKKISGRRFTFNLFSSTFVSKFIKIMARVVNHGLKNENIRKKDKKSFQLNDLCIKLKRYKVTESIIFKVFNEKIINTNSFYFINK
jgi:hypothetical protein